MAGGADELEPRPLGLLISAAIPAAFAVYAGLRTTGLMQAKRELFEGLGAPIPPLTEMVLGWPNLWWIIAIPAVVVFTWIAARSLVTRAQKTRMKLAVAGVIVFAAAVYGFVLYAMMLPMWAIGGAV